LKSVALLTKQEVKVKLPVLLILVFLSVNALAQQNIIGLQRSNRPPAYTDFFLKRFDPASNSFKNLIDTPMIRESVDVSIHSEFFTYDRVNKRMFLTYKKDTIHVINLQTGKTDRIPADLSPIGNHLLYYPQYLPQQDALFNLCVVPSSTGNKFVLYKLDLKAQHKQLLPFAEIAPGYSLPPLYGYANTAISIARQEMYFGLTDELVVVNLATGQVKKTHLSMGSATKVCNLGYSEKLQRLFCLTSATPFGQSSDNDFYFLSEIDIGNAQVKQISQKSFYTMITHTQGVIDEEAGVYAIPTFLYSGDYAIIAVDLATGVPIFEVPTGDIFRCMASMNSFNPLVNVASAPSMGIQILSVYPNPATDKLLIQLSGITSSVEGRLTDMNGGTVKKFVISSPEQLISITGLKPGVYILQVGDAQTKVLVAGAN
jgi:hypothetical protein